MTGGIFHGQKLLFADYQDKTATKQNTRCWTLIGQFVSAYLFWLLHIVTCFAVHRDHGSIFWLFFDSSLNGRTLTYPHVSRRSVLAIFSIISTSFIPAYAMWIPSTHIPIEFLQRRDKKAPARYQPLAINQTINQSTNQPTTHSVKSTNQSFFLQNTKTFVNNILIWSWQHLHLSIRQHTKRDRHQI